MAKSMKDSGRSKKTDQSFKQHSTDNFVFNYIVDGESEPPQFKDYSDWNVPTQRSIYAIPPSQRMLNHSVSFNDLRK